VTAVAFLLFQVCLPPERCETINKIYEQSRRECAQFYSQDATCLSGQFDRNFRWFVLKYDDRITGPPGVPGPAGNEDRGAALRRLEMEVDRQRAEAHKAEPVVDNWAWKYREFLIELREFNKELDAGLWSAKRWRRVTKKFDALRKQ
jgi:hypothetical protein